jgi:8-oxo-dGTP pyrophosphatase MutT (NUDIX family)
MELQLHLKMNIVPPVAKRGQHALILLRNSRGEFLLGGKDIYPENIYRMVGGGMDDEEEPYTAAQRELQEETGLKVGIDQLYHLATIYSELFEESTQKTIHFATHVFYFNVGNQKLVPSDDINVLKPLTESELQDLIKRYLELPKTIDSDKGFSWYDYGQLYSPIHRIALEATQELQ